MQYGAMETSDRRWRVEVGGVGSITWYRLVGADSTRNLPSLAALVQALTDLGIDLGDLHEVAPAAQPSPRSAAPPTA
jgi:hypothetical protein